MKLWKRETSLEQLIPRLYDATLGSVEVGGVNVRQYDLKALREAFMALLLDSCAAAGSALLFVSHDARLAPRFGRVVDLPTINHAAQGPA